MPVHLEEHFAAGRHIPGVFYLRSGVSIGRIIEELYLIWFASQAEEYQDRILFIIISCAEYRMFFLCQKRTSNN